MLLNPLNKLSKNVILELAAATLWNGLGNTLVICKVFIQCSTDSVCLLWFIAAGIVINYCF